MSEELRLSLRNQLGRVIVEARSVAEAGAKKALESLAVGHHEPHGSMSLEERDLRVRLRARGRQLGDVRDRQRGSQSIDRLTHEVAYEHWHRMLFARFLAENGLLVHPEHEVAMSVRDIEELALETSQDSHQLAAGFAQNSLPQIFRTGDPVLEVILAPETRQKLEVLLDSLPTEVFAADDSLGWTYQYWQTEKKDSVNASGEKIGANELPAVTQLFTEHYMVMFLYHNTLGAWHAGKVLADNPGFAATAHNEDELRRAVALKTDAGDSEWDYLRFVREPQEKDKENSPTGPWRPAAGTFDGWPKPAKELKVLDPCCGSGHFLVAGFKLLTRMRMLEEGLSLEDAIKAVLESNLFGLELDPRCTQIAAFNLALAAWRWVGAPIDLPALNIACSGLSIGSSKKDWLTLADSDERLKAGLSDLYELFRLAPELGSLIDPKSLGEDMFAANFEELQPLLQEALAKDSSDEETIEQTVTAQGMAKAAEILAGEYTLVTTNVPYLSIRKQSEQLKRFLTANYQSYRQNLASAFVARASHLCASGGSTAVVCLQDWMFLDVYTDMRKGQLLNSTWNIAARLGTNGFSTPLWAMNVMLFVFTRTQPSETTEFLTLDVSTAATPEAKSNLLLDKAATVLTQSRQLDNTDARIVFETTIDAPLLSNFASALMGVSTGDGVRFNRCFWEVSAFGDTWQFLQSTVKCTTPWGGRSEVIRWELGRGQIKALADSVRHLNHSAQNWARGRPNWERQGVVVSQMGNLPTTLYAGDIYDCNCCALVPHTKEDVAAIWSFCVSGEFTERVREINQALKVPPHTLLKIPFESDRWRKKAKESLPLPEPQSDDPTQWLFHGHPAKAEAATILQVAVSRLLGYCWPPELDSEMWVADEVRDWVARCEELNDFADEDGIVCLPAIRSEPPAADRLRSLLATALRPNWSNANERELLAATAGEGKKPSASLETWLRDRFFEEHCKLFHYRPFIWHVWDGRRDGFHCLINAHRLTGAHGQGRRTLEALTYSYLGDWIQRQKDDQKTMVEGADARLIAAHILQEQLVKILQGEPPYDLFIRWKPLSEQAIGWEPDVNDGVRLNIRPFMSAELRKGGKKGAGILRWKPNIKWTKDRGKEPEVLCSMESFPWFWCCNGNGSMADRTDYTAERAGKAKFDGNRWNDLHYSRAVKEAARAAAKDSGK